MEPKTISQTPMTLAELKEEIAKIKQREKEPSIRLTRVEDYLNSFAEISPEAGKELHAAITKLGVNRLKEEHICKIVDMLPKTPNELKVVLQGYGISLANDASSKIIERVNEFSAKEK